MSFLFSNQAFLCWLQSNLMYILLLKNVKLPFFFESLFCHLFDLNFNPVVSFTLQVSTDAGVDTLIPLSLQGKDNPILQQLLPTLLNPAVLGKLEQTLYNTSLSKLNSAC